MCTGKEFPCANDLLRNTPTCKETISGMFIWNSFEIFKISRLAHFLRKQEKCDNINIYIKKVHVQQTDVQNLKKRFPDFDFDVWDADGGTLIVQKF